LLLAAAGALADDLSNSPGSSTGWEASVGTQPEARAKSIARTADWLEKANR
jgi:hypothetical protein